MNFKSFIMSAALAVSLIAPAQAGSWSVDGYIGTEARIFTQDYKLQGQVNNPDLSLLVNPEFRYRSDDRTHRVNIIPFLRASTVDAERSHGDIREAHWLYLGDEIEFLAGINRVFWGVAESRHLVNVINQIDQIEDPDQEDYLGQPMISLASQRDWGRIEGFLMPYFRERTFAGEEGRLRGALVVDADKADYESSAEQLHPDIALRYSHYLGDIDVGLSYFYGTSREASFTLGSNGKLRPYYSLMHQGGIDLQYTTESWLWKFEGLFREGQGDSFAAAVGGFEYTFYQINDSDVDLGLLLEYQYDGRDFEAPPVASDDDIFAAARLAFNDTQDSEILAGFTIDRDNGDMFWNLEAERRIGDDYQLELRARFITGADQGDDLYDFARDDYLQIRFARYF